MTLALLASTTLRVSAVLLCALVAATLLRRRAAAVRSQVLATGICGALLIPLLAVSLPSWHVDLAGTASSTGQRATPSAPTGDLSVSTSVSVTVSPGEATVAGAARLAPRGGTFVPRVSTLLLSIWAFGVVIGVVGLATGVTRLVAISARAGRVDNGPWVDLLRERMADDPVARRVRILRTTHPTLLVAWGWRRPRILIPADADTWTRDRIAVVLDHELAHVRRMDWPLQMASEVVRTLAWFNPIAWLAVNRLRLESERACDDEVIARGASPSDYAQHLVSLARALSASRLWLPAPAMARVSSLERRVNAMLDHHIARTPLSRAVRLSIVAVGIALTASIASFAQSSFATITGTVRDQLGGTIPGVTVSVRDDTSGAKHEIRTSDRGTYELPGLVPGNYTFEVWAAGFKTQESALQLAAGQSARRDVSLPVGELQETISVAESVPTATATRPVNAPAKSTSSSMACSAEPNSGRIQPPRKVTDVRPHFPDALRGTGADGLVHLKARIGTDGAIREVQTVDATNPEFEQSAIDAVRQWRFTQTLLNCVPIEVEMNVALHFGVNDGATQRLGPSALPPPPPPPPPAPIR